MLTIRAGRFLSGLIAILFPFAVVADEAEGPSLTIGSAAPELDVEHWVSDGHGKFKPVTAFEPDKVYVVEFWATWCGPCIASMPHLAETQEKYADKGVQIVSISDEDLETVEGFLKRPVKAAAKKPVAAEGKGDASENEETDKKPQTYGELTSAYCLTTDPDRSVATAYMEAAGQNGIPTCFIVGKTGHVEWIGHPMAMDNPLQQVVDGKWDRETFLVRFKKQQEQSQLISKVSRLIRNDKKDEAMELVRHHLKEAEADGDQQSVQLMKRLELQLLVNPALAKIQAGDAEGGLTDLNEALKSVDPQTKLQVQSTAFRLLMGVKQYTEAAGMLEDLAKEEKTEPNSLNALAWTVYETAKDEKDFSKELIAAATTITEKAMDAAPENGMIIDTMAHLVYLAGDLERAVDLQKQAVQHAPKDNEEMKADMEKFLQDLEKEAAGK